MLEVQRQHLLGELGQVPHREAARSSLHWSVVAAQSTGCFEQALSCPHLRPSGLQDTTSCLRGSDTMSKLHGDSRIVSGKHGESPRL